MTTTSMTPLYTYTVVNEYPHDPSAYCQGLVFDQGALYEGTGKYGESSLRQVELETGKVVQHTPLDRKFFGEGIAIWKDRIFQLTWRERRALVYDKQTLQPTGEVFRYQGEGWGLTTDGKSLIRSDGTSGLRFLDPETFEVIRRVTVTEGRRRVTNLNELEYIEGEVFANVWKQDYILRISPRNGRVTGRVDLGGLRSGRRSFGSEAVLNGIAYDAETGRLFVTGKNWPTLFEIRLRETTGR
jgi:glutamine cyclotransferase